MNPIARPDVFHLEARDLNAELRDLDEMYGLLHELRYGVRRAGDSAGRGDGEETPIERIHCTCAQPTPVQPNPSPCPRCTADAAIRSISDWLLLVRKQINGRLKMTDRALGKFDAPEGVTILERRRVRVATGEIAASKESAEVRKAEQRVTAARQEMANAEAALAKVTDGRIDHEAKRRDDERAVHRRQVLHAIGRPCGKKGCVCMTPAGRKRFASKWGAA
jgi:hypothetical protein